MLNQKNIIIVGSVIVLSFGLITAMAMFINSGKNDTKKITDDKKIEGPLTAEQLNAYNVTMTNKDNPIATLTTNKGEVKIELFKDTMPITVGNFIKLTKEGFYDGVKFHRVIPGFMIQSGDPITKTDEYLRYGTGGPGYTIPDEFVKGQYLTNVRGTIAMANSGPESGGSQFFINVADNTNLDFDKPPFTSKHPVFGRVLEGMSVVDGIAETETNTNDMPVDPIIIEKLTVDHE